MLTHLKITTVALTVLIVGLPAAAQAQNADGNATGILDFICGQVSAPVCQAQILSTFEDEIDRILPVLESAAAQLDEQITPAGMERFRALFALSPAERLDALLTGPEDSEFDMVHSVIANSVSITLVAEAAIPIARERQAELLSEFQNCGMTATFICNGIVVEMQELGFAIDRYEASTTNMDIWLQDLARRLEDRHGSSESP